MTPGSNAHNIWRIAERFSKSFPAKDVTFRSMHGGIGNVEPTLSRIITRKALVGLIIGLAGLTFASGGCASRGGKNSELLVFAAASLRDVLVEVGETYESQSGVKVSFSFAGSQTLARQIAAGAPADLFISAGSFPVEFLDDQVLLESEPVNLASNRLVVAFKSTEPGIESIQQLSEIPELRIAIADPNLAPAGRYARESLSNLGLWDPLRDNLVLGADVRAALAYLETGNADVALVYNTDARNIHEVGVLDIIPAESYTPVVYPALVVKDSARQEQAGQFLKFLQSDAGQQIFRKYGFDPL